MGGSLRFVPVKKNRYLTDRSVDSNACECLIQVKYRRNKPLATGMFAVVMKAVADWISRDRQGLCQDIFLSFFGIPHILEGFSAFGAEKFSVFSYRFSDV
jgi:hypothetical protein